MSFCSRTPWRTPRWLWSCVSLSSVYAGENHLCWYRQLLLVPFHSSIVCDCVEIAQSSCGWAPTLFPYILLECCREHYSHQPRRGTNRRARRQERCGSHIQWNTTQPWKRMGSFAATCVDLEIIPLAKINQRQVSYDTTYGWNPMRWVSLFTEQKQTHRHRKLTVSKRERGRGIN